MSTALGGRVCRLPSNSPHDLVTRWTRYYRRVTSSPSVAGRRGLLARVGLASLPPPNMISSHDGTETALLARGRDGASPPGSRARRRSLVSSGPSTQAEACSGVPWWPLAGAIQSASPARPPRARGRRDGHGRSGAATGAAARSRTSSIASSPSGSSSSYRGTGVSRRLVAVRRLLAAAELAVADQPAPLVVVGRDEVAGLVVAELGAPGLAVTVVRRDQGPPAVGAAPGVPLDLLGVDALLAEPGSGGLAERADRRRRVGRGAAHGRRLGRCGRRGRARRAPGAAKTMIFSTDVPAAAATSSGDSPARIRAWMSRGRSALSIFLSILWFTFSFRMPRVGVADVVPVADSARSWTPRSAAQDLVDPGDGDGVLHALAVDQHQLRAAAGQPHGVRSCICSEPPPGSPRPA